MLAFLVALLGASSLAAVSPATATVPPAAPGCTISDTLVNSCRPWLGAESGGYGVTGLRASMLEHESRIGRPLDIVHEYLGPGAVMTNDVVTLANRPGTIPLVNWKVSDKWATADGSSATVNAQIDAMATSIKALGGTKIMLAVFHEPENDISAGGDPNCPNTAFSGTAGATADYVNMWHNVRQRFDQLGVTNVVWVMNYMGWKGWNCVVKDLWPGNQYVDWVTWDPYPNAATWTSFVGDFYSYLTANNDATHDFLSKPWGLSEFGYVGTSQTAAYALYDEALRDIKNNVFPKLKAYVVWDQHTAVSKDDRVAYTSTGASDPVEQAHYNGFANDPIFSDGLAIDPPVPTDPPVPPVPPVPTDLTAPTVTLASPTAGSTVTGTTTVSGSASDDVGVTSASLLVDGKVVASAAAATGAVGFTWDTSTVPDGTHTVALQATDAAANIGTSTSVQVTVRNAVTVADTSPPTAPTNLTATLSGGTVKLTWAGSSDNVAVTGYTVYRGGVAVAISTATSYTDLTPPPGTSSSYTVKATDAAGNLSGVSNTVSVAVPADKTLPTAPTNLKAVAGTKQVALTWTAAKDNVGVAHYYLYRGNVKYQLLGNVTSFTDTGLTTNTKYSYKVYALDAAGNWSAASTNVTATAR